MSEPIPPAARPGGEGTREQIDAVLRTVEHLPCEAGRELLAFRVVLAERHAADAPTSAPCLHCDGTGSAISDDTICLACEGSGVAPDETDPYFVLDFCEGAIRDALTLEDGLDAASGESVLRMIANAKAARSSAPAGEAEMTDAEEAAFLAPLKPFLDAQMRERVAEMNADLLDDADRALRAWGPPTPEHDNPLYYPLLFLARALRSVLRSPAPASGAPGEDRLKPCVTCGWIQSLDGTAATCVRCLTTRLAAAERAGVALREALENVSSAVGLADNEIAHGDYIAESARDIRRARRFLAEADRTARAALTPTGSAPSPEERANG